MQVINIADHTNAKRKSDILEVLDELREAVINDEITEFIASSIDSEGDVQIHACIKDVVGGIGMFEAGKHILMTTEL